MIPKITFVYSDVYDRRWKFGFEKREPKKVYPTEKDIRTYIRKAEKKWRPLGNKILKEISLICRLSWHEDIKCYVVGNTRPFSDPLTIKLYDDMNEFVDVMTHELIHNIRSQNEDTLRKFNRFIDKRYPGETKSTRVHISVHAIHTQVYMSLFTKKRLNKDIQKCQDHIEYKRAWDIVQHDESENSEKIKKIKVKLC